jgi:DNA recombination protein RmuC
MREIMFILLAGLAAGVAAWAWATLRARTALGAAQARLASQEGVAEELRTSLAAARAESGRLQETLRTASAAQAAAEARLDAARASLDEQHRLLDEAKARLTEAFQSLAAETLRVSSEDFLRLADQRFKALSQAAEGDLEARRTAIATLVQPLQQSLEAYQRESRELEEKRQREIGSVGRQLSMMAEAQTALTRETANLVHALRAPQVRGRWGEIALRKTAELAGMTRHCDFVEQESVATDGGRLRPDMIVRLPGRREIVVDAKVALNAYLDALEAPTPELREAALVRHTQQVRSHVKRLAAKEYWSQFPQAPDFVVLFIPGETFYAAAAERDPDLLQDALANQVLVATPTTFVGLLLTAAYGWRQEQVAENAQRISELGRQVHERIGTMIEHLAKVGEALEVSVKAYNRAVASLEARVLPATRRFTELGAGSAKEVPRLEAVDQVPRPPAAALPGPEL